MAKDFLLDNDNDLLIRDGDLVIGDSEEQEVGLILRGNMGDFPSSPFLGFGVAQRMRNELAADQFARELDTHLRLDGFSDTNVRLSASGKLQISAKRHD